MKRLGFVKISVAFATFLVFTSAILGYLFLIGDQEIENRDFQVRHTYNIIQKAKDISALTEGMLANQRGYIMTGREDFMDEYKVQKSEMQSRLNALASLTREHPVQTSRFADMQHAFELFTNALEQRAERFHFEKHVVDERFLEQVNAISVMRTTILAINAEALNQEYALLSERIAEVEKQKEEYYKTIFLGGIGSILFFFIVNIGVLYLLSRRAQAEESLRSSEDRFQLAIEGTNDGIFDWDIKREEIFFSRQFFSMLGIDRKGFVGSPRDFRELVHPDDEFEVWRYIERYLRKELSEYSNTFRMKHASGRWVWINSRAKATFDARGNPLRMVGANSDITYMKEYQEHLKEEKTKAEEASRSKSDFLAHMSHEIRTPLTAISGISEIFMRNDVNLDDKQRRLLRVLSTSTETLKDLVNDILDFSRIEGGELELARETFRLGSVFQQVISIMSVNASEKGLAFSFNDDSLRHADFIGDPLRLRQVLINLVGNAVKFTDKGSVTVEARREDHDGAAFLRVEVRDTGIGISPENQEIIFDRFKQVDSSVARKYGGSGLGLSICRNLVQLMGGRLSVESQLGQGATFTILIPWYGPDGNQEAGKDASLDIKLRERVKSRISGQDRILIVEDYEGNIVVVGYILEEMGCVYDVARNGLEALELWKKHHYDVVLMDVQMPEMDGFSATAGIRRLEAEKNLPRTPIIGMTAHALIGDKSKCIEAGMDAYLPKPIIEDDLRSEILRFLKDKAVA